MERNDPARVAPAEKVTNSNRDEPDIPPPDTGLKAWLLLFACFLFEANLWGFPYAFGVFQNYYSEVFLADRRIPLIAVLSTGLFYLGGPAATLLVQRYQRYRMPMIWLSFIVCFGALIAASFATTVDGLIATQGALYSIGVLIFYYPLFGILNEWFVQKRGFAYGILISSGGAAGIAFPFVLDVILRKYGYQTTLRAVTVYLAVTTIPCAFLVRPRLPVEPKPLDLRQVDWKFLRKPAFYIYSASNIFQGLGFFFPALFLPSYATSIGLSSSQGALVLALASATQIPGQLIYGILSDGKIPLNVLALSSSLIAGITLLSAWGNAHSMPVLIAFALVYGFFVQGYVVLFTRMSMRISEDPTIRLLVWSLFCFQKGIGNVASGPISAVLLRDAVHPMAYGADKFMPVVLFSGACLLASAIIIGSWSLCRRLNKATRTPG